LPDFEYAILSFFDRRVSKEVCVFILFIINLHRGFYAERVEFLPFTREEFVLEFYPMQSESVEEAFK
jgi:hypothetical protein